MRNKKADEMPSLPQLAYSVLYSAFRIPHSAFEVFGAVRYTAGH
jgi:hypothetical protein